MSQAKLQEIANRGLQDKLPPEKRAIFDEAVKRGLVSLPETGSNTPLNIAGEGAAAFNRTIIDGIDFMTVDQVNNILQLAGSEIRIPTLREQTDKLGVTQGNFMEEGLAQDLVVSAGQAAPAALAMTQVGGRNLASASGAAAELLGFGSARNPAAAASKNLVAQGQDLGIPVLTSDVMPPKTFPGRMARDTAEKIPIAGTAGPRQLQQQMRNEAVGKIVNKYGVYSFDNIITSLKSQKNRVKNAAGSVLENTSKKLDSLGDIPLTNTKAAIKGAKQGLSKKGVIKSPGALNDLQELINAIDESPQTFTSMKENRTAFSDLLDSVDPAKRSQLGSNAKRVLTKVRQAMTQDMEGFAKKELSPEEFNKWKRANTVYAGEAVKLKRTKLKNVLDKGDVTPETVRTMLFSQNESEQRLLYKSLDQFGRENAKAAIISKIVDDARKLKDGLTPNSFVTRMNKHRSQIDIFFKGDEKAQLKGLMEVLDATRRAQDAAMTTPTGQQLIGGLSVTGLYLDPVATITSAGTVGGLARLYESAPVRNALLKLGSLPPRSNKYGEAILAAHFALVSGAALEDRQGKATE